MFYLKIRSLVILEQFQKDDISESFTQELSKKYLSQFPTKLSKDKGPGPAFPNFTLVK